MLHNPESPRGVCLEPDFVRGVTALGKQGLSFDLCMRPGELLDGLKLSEKCPDTRFVVDHCGNADPKAFDKKLAGDAKPEHEVDPWRRDMEALSKRPNVICKISGIVARAEPCIIARATIMVAMDASDTQVPKSDWTPPMTFEERLRWGIVPGRWTLRYRIWKEMTLDSAVRLRHAPGGHPLAGTHGHTFTLRVISAGELELAARLAGLELVAAYGDYEGSPVADGDDRHIAVFAHARRRR